LLSPVSQLQTEGFCILEDCLSALECQEWCNRVSSAIELSTTSGRLQAKVADQNVTYGSRNLLSIFPQVTQLLATPRIASLCREVLGNEYGIVRGLFFDKPPGVSWSLPWHQDLTIAVREHIALDHESIDGFTKPTVKAGVCHLEAPIWLLENMLTVRIHLDAMNERNGPVLVRKGSHLGGKLALDAESFDFEASELHCPPGSVMMMRPLLCHSSIASLPDSNLHRRTIHLELSSVAKLPHGLVWHSFLPIA